MTNKTPKKIIAQQLAKQLTAEQVADILAPILERYSTADETDRAMLDAASRTANESPFISTLSRALELDQFIVNPEKRLEIFSQYSDELFAEIPAKDIVQAVYQKEVEGGIHQHDGYKPYYKKFYLDSLRENAAHYGNVELLQAVDEIAATDPIVRINSLAAFHGALVNNHPTVINYLIATTPELAKYAETEADLYLGRARETPILSAKEVRERIASARENADLGIFHSQANEQQAIQIEASLLSLGIEGINLDGKLDETELAQARKAIGAQEGEEVSMGDIAQRLTEKVSPTQKTVRE